MTFASARHTENMALLSLVDGGSRGRLACFRRVLLAAVLKLASGLDVSLMDYLFMYFVYLYVSF